MGNDKHTDQDDKQQDTSQTNNQTRGVNNRGSVNRSEKTLRERVLESLNQETSAPTSKGYPTQRTTSLEENKETVAQEPESIVSHSPEEKDLIEKDVFTGRPDVLEANSESVQNRPVNNELKESAETRQGVEKLSSRQKESRRRRDGRQKENSMVKKIVVIVIISLILMIGMLGFSFYRYWTTGLEPLNPKDKQLVQVEIPIGTSNKGIGSILEKKKIIKSGLVFTYYVKTNNLTDFKGGFYQMSPDMTLEEVGNLLKKGGTDEPVDLADARLTIPEGFSITQIAEAFGKNTDKTKEEFLAVVENQEFFNKLVASYPELLASVKDAKDVRYRLEGYLFPATYNYYKETTIEEIITQMVDKTNSVLETKKADIATSNLTIQQLLTLASLVEKEGVEESDRRNIAQVFLNRIVEDMPLQSDISILYAMDQHKVHLSNKDTEIESPYNLYVNRGYGPGPFNSPSEQAIDSVLHPEPNDYIYFLADVTTHKVYFAKTYEEHLKLKEEYIDNKK